MSELQEIKKALKKLGIDNDPNLEMKILYYHYELCGLEEEKEERDFSSSADRQDNYDLFLVNYFNFLGQEQILESASDLMPVEGNSDLYYAYVDLTEEADGKRNGTLQYFLLSVSEETFWTFQVSLYDTEKSITEVDALVEDVLSTMTIKAE